MKKFVSMMLSALLVLSLAAWGASKRGVPLRMG